MNQNSPTVLIIEDNREAEGRETEAVELEHAHGPENLCWLSPRQEIEKRGVFLSPVTSKPASRGRIKTGHSEALNSYQVS